jgi:hypothetical protein
MSKTQSHHASGCLELPRFERVKYFYGQLLGVRELQSEQSYFLEKHRLHNRYLHGYGVVCGLGVTPCRVPEDPCDEPSPKGEQPREKGSERAEQDGEDPKLCVTIDCGLALDCRGNELVVPHPFDIDLLDKLDCDEQKAARDGKPVYVSLLFVEQPVEPVRPLTVDSCGGIAPDCVPSRLRDDFCVRVSLEPPAPDRSCSACQHDCCDPRLPLARVRWHGGKLEIDTGVRRMLAPFVATRIESVSWRHGAAYDAHVADAMLHEGLVIRFTDAVYASTLARGVLDVWVVQGGGGRRGDIYNVDVELLPEGNDELTRSVKARVRNDHRERIDPGDRVLIQLRSAFVLDRCCRPIDGDHAGGRVAQAPQHAQKWQPVMTPPPLPCAPHEQLPRTPWTSGNGTIAGNFESWFHVTTDKAKG